MGHLFFSPNGRIGPDAFMRGAYILIAISFVLNVLPLISFQLGSIFGILGLVLIWCWIVLFIKRLHDGGRSGWLCLLPIVAFIILSIIISQLVTQMFAAELSAQLEEATVEAAESGSFGDIMKVTMEMSKEIAQKIALPSAIGGAVVSYVIALITNNAVKSDPGDNQYGPAT